MLVLKSLYELTCSDFFRRPWFQACEPAVLLDSEPAPADVTYDVHACLLCLYADMGGGRQECCFWVGWMRSQENGINHSLANGSS